MNQLDHPSSITISTVNRLFYLLNVTFLNIPGVDTITCKELEDDGCSGNSDTCSKILFTTEGLEIEDSCNCNMTNTKTIISPISSNVTSVTNSTTG